METIGVIGLGNIGLAIAENLMKSGYRVVGFRRSSMAEFEKLGGVPAQSAAAVGKESDIVLSCVGTAEALADVMQGERGLIHSARPGQLIVELGSHRVPQKQSHVGPLAAKGAVLLDGEVSGTPGMVRARKAVVFLGGDEQAAQRAEPIVKAFTDHCVYFGPFGTASRVKLINNLLVAINIAAAGEAVALGRKAGVDMDKMIKALSAGSGGSTQFTIRAPAMAEKRFMPPQGTARLLSHYFPMIDDFVAGVGGASPLFARAVDLYRHAIETGFGDQDVSIMVEVLANWPRNTTSMSNAAE